MPKKKNEYISLKDIISNIGFIAKYLFKLNKKLYYFRVPLILLNIVSSLIVPYLFACLINGFTVKINIELVVLFVITIAVANFTTSIVQRIILKYDRREHEKTMLKIKLVLGDNVSGLPFSDIEQPRVRDFISLAQNTSSFSRIIDALTAFFSSVIGIITYSAILINIQPWIVIVIISTIIIQLIIDKLKLNYNNKWRMAQEPFFRKLWYHEGLLCDPRYGKEVRVNSLKDWLEDKINTIYKKDCAPIVKSNVRDVNLLDLFMQIVKISENVFVYFLLTYKVVFRNMSIGNFTFCLSNTSNLTNSLTSFSNSVFELNECGAFVNEFRFLVNLFEKRVPDFGDRKHNGNDFSIEFKNVSFKYPNAENWVLKNVSFKICTGETLSLVGNNGSGKTTIVKLLCRYYKPTDGTICIGGVNIDEYSPEEYKKLLGIVFQDYKLFSFSVLENIIVGENYDSDRLNYSVFNSGLKDRIEKLIRKENTFIYKDFDEKGVELSGGEGQKLSICRALYKNAPIMILDEPTASLDPIAEYEMFRSFHKVTKDKTAIFISHRLSSTRFTDKIAVLQNGVLCEFGSHSELIKNEDGVYKNMFVMQQQYYT